MSIYVHVYYTVISWNLNCGNISGMISEFSIQYREGLDISYGFPRTCASRGGGGKYTQGKENHVKTAKAPWKKNVAKLLN